MNICDHQRCTSCNRGDVPCCECQTIDGCTEWSCIYHGDRNMARVIAHRRELRPTYGPGPAADGTRDD